MFGYGSEKKSEALTYHEFYTTFLDILLPISRKYASWAISSVIFLKPNKWIIESCVSFHVFLHRNSILLNI